MKLTQETIGTFSETYSALEDILSKASDLNRKAMIESNIRKYTPYPEGMELSCIIPCAERKEIECLFSLCERELNYMEWITLPFSACVDKKALDGHFEALKQENLSVLHSLAGYELQVKERQQREALERENLRKLAYGEPTK